MRQLVRVPAEPVADGGRRPGPERLVLADGTTVEIRAIRPEDVGALVAFHEGLSFDTVYRRFFGVHPHLSAPEAEHFCTIDPTARFALVAVVNGEIVGVARMERIGAGSTAEVAFVVADKFQHHGLGRLLAQRLAAVAPERGVRRFVAEVLPGNRPMLRLLPAAGFEVGVSVADGVVHLSCPIAVTEPPEGVPTDTESSHSDNSRGRHLPGDTKCPSITGGVDGGQR